MEHFAIIQALCRASLASGGPAVKQQIERLRDAVQATGDNEAARSLEKLLAQTGRVGEMAPSKLVQSRNSQIAGEDLSPNTPLPVDRETSAPLVDVYFADQLPAAIPIFEGRLNAAAQTLVQEWKSAERLRSMGVEPATTCLIYGPPGTGKTTLALWLAKELGVPAVVARLDGLISSFLGTTSRNVGNLFSFVNRYRCVLVLDEFDAIAKVRDDPHEVGEIKRVVNALLQNVDSRRSVGITVAVTNHEALLDPAIWRRFEIQLQVPKPSMNERLSITRLNIAPLQLGDVAERFIAWLTEELSGSEVETFVKNLKKHIAVNDTEPTQIIDVLRGLVTLNGSRMSIARTSQLAQPLQELAAAVIADEKLGFTQADVGSLLNRDKSTIGRWLATDEPRGRGKDGKRTDSSSPQR